MNKYYEEVTTQAALRFLLIDSPRCEDVLTQSWFQSKMLLDSLTNQIKGLTNLLGLSQVLVASVVCDLIP